MSGRASCDAWRARPRRRLSRLPASFDVPRGSRPQALLAARPSPSVVERVEHVEAGRARPQRSTPWSGAAARAAKRASCQTHGPYCATSSTRAPLIRCSSASRPVSRQAMRSPSPLGMDADMVAEPVVHQLQRGAARSRPGTSSRTRCCQTVERGARDRAAAAPARCAATSLPSDQRCRSRASRRPTGGSSRCAACRRR